MYIKQYDDNIIIIELYADDIIFGNDDDSLIQQFPKDMQKDFKMSFLSELTFYLGLQISQSTEGIFNAQTKYIKEMLNKFNMEYCKHVSTPMITDCKISKED